MKNFILKIVKVFIFCIALNGYSQGGCDTKWFKSLLEEISKNNSKLKKIKDNPDALAAYEFFYRTGKVNDNLEVDDLIKLGKDFARKTETLDGKKLYNAFNETPNLLDEWLIINNKSNLRMQPDVLQSVAKVRKNTKLKELGLTDNVLSKIEGADGLSYKQIIDNLNKFGKKVSNNNITLENFSNVLGQLKQGGSKSDGANWIVKYLGDNANDFTGKKLKFESYESTSLGGRYVDVLDNAEDNFKVFYEFKSVKNVPPKDFNEQFLKDLSNTDNLDQIKWIFNGAKNPPKFKDNLIDAIDKLNIDKKIYEKFGKNSSEQFKDYLVDNFDKIFKNG